MSSEALSEPIAGARRQPAGDPLRDQLLEAAKRVFASQGYAGTKIMDIVKASGLSSGAVYGRFASKNELLLAAVLDSVEANPVADRLNGRSVTEMLVESSHADRPLDDEEAVELEAFIAARREPALAEAIAEARLQWRETIVEPLIERAELDGSASPDADFDSIVYLMQTLQLGLMVQRGAGQYAPDEAAWQEFIEELLRAVAHPDGAPTSSTAND